MRECLSPEEMASLADGRVTPAQRKELLQHVSRCEECLPEYLFLLELKEQEAGVAAKDGAPANPATGAGGGSTGGIGEVVAAVAGAGAAIIAPFAWHGDGAHEQKVAAAGDHNDHGGAGHGNNFPADERNGRDSGTTHQSDEPNMNHPLPSNDLHPAPHHFGPDSSNQTSYDVNQHYSDTCAIRSQQLILRDFGVNINQEDLIREARANGWYDHGTSLPDVGKLLELNGVAVNRMSDANEYNLFHELAQGHEVIVAVNSNQLWQQDLMESVRYSLFGGQADHALIVAGIDTSDANHPTVILKDPGTGQVAKEYPMHQFMDAWKGSHCYMVSTQEPAPFYLPQMAHFDYSAGHVQNMPDTIEGHHDLGHFDPTQHDLGHHDVGHTGHHQDPTGHHDPNSFDAGHHDPGHHDDTAHHDTGHHDF